MVGGGGRGVECGLTSLMRRILCGGGRGGQARGVVWSCITPMSHIVCRSYITHKSQREGVSFSFFDRCKDPLLKTL